MFSKRLVLALIALVVGVTGCAKYPVVVRSTTTTLTPTAEISTPVR